MTMNALSFIGRLVLWAAVMAGSLTLLVILLMGQDFDTLKSGLKDYIGKALKDGMPPMEGRPPLDDEQLSAMTDIAVAVMPAASAVSWLTALIFNLWLAGRITLASGQLSRPWPDLSAMEYPPGTALMLLASILAAGAKGIAGAVGTAFLGAFFLAYVLIGLAVVHFVTRAKPWRPFALWVLYGGLLLINVWIAVIIGGPGRTTGAVAGSLILMVFLEGSRFARDWVPGVSEVQMASVRLAIVGLALILFTLYRPQGIMRLKQ